jgi:RNA polymerase sigma-70 factor, ECF subfamily
MSEEDMKTNAVPETARDTTALWSEFRRPLAAFIAKRVRRPADVDDVLQEVFIRIHRNVETLEESEHVLGWIFTTARNALIDYERARATRSDPRQVSAAELDVGIVEDPEDRAAEVVPCLRPMLAKLPGRYRDGIQLTELDGLTQAAAARLHGLSLSGMKSRIQRGRERLKDLILSCCQVELDVRGSVMDVDCACGERASRKASR